MSYRIVRNYFRNDAPDRPTIKRGLTLKEARAHCQDPETSSKTATSGTARAHTRAYGPWFDEYEKE